MPNSNEVLTLWVSEVKTELKERHNENIQQRLDFERLKTEVRVRNKIIWALVTILIAAAGAIIALIAVLQHV